jgi:hypothetical protein
MSHKAQYKKELIYTLTAQNKDTSPEVIKSVLAKVAIHSRNKYGSVSFEDELLECGISNGLCFYNEHGKQDTYNRQISKAIK